MATGDKGDVDGGGGGGGERRARRVAPEHQQWWSKPIAQGNERGARVKLKHNEVLNFNLFGYGLDMLFAYKIQYKSQNQVLKGFQQHQERLRWCKFPSLLLYQGTDEARESRPGAQFEDRLSFDADLTTVEHFCREKRMVEHQLQSLYGQREG